MANFELTGYVKDAQFIGTRTRLTVAEYIQGKRSDDGSVYGEKMDLWYIFFPSSSRRHLSNFKRGDLVIVKGTIHQSDGKNKDFIYAVNGECIKHFYTRNLLDEIQREKVSLENMDESPDLVGYMESDF